MAASSFFVFVGFGALLALPAFTNELYYRKLSGITQQTVSNLKIAHYVSNASFIIAWFVAVGTSGKPLDMDTEVFDDSDDEDGAGANYSDEESTAVE